MSRVYARFRLIAGVAANFDIDPGRKWRPLEDITNQPTISQRTPVTWVSWQLPEPATLGNQDQMISAYELAHNILADQLHSLDDNSWNHQAWLIQGTDEILLKDTVGGLLWIALFDIVHHRGQLSTYIRPMGGKVPSVYGPSADDAGERH